MRYTHKLDKPEGRCNYFLTPDEEECDNAENKLGQLEDFEEERGIELVTLFKAFRQGHIWVKKKDKVVSSCDYNLGLTGTTYDLYCKDVDKWLLVKDYGKTWALTKEELE